MTLTASNNLNPSIEDDEIFLSAKDIRTIFNNKRSIAWIYCHAVELGGVKIGGLWIFTKEEFKYALQGKRKKDLARKGYISGQAVYKEMQDKKRGYGMGKRKMEVFEEKANRHGLLDSRIK